MLVTCGSWNFDETTKELIGVEADIKVASLTTENSKRDGHLKSPDFFDVTKFPSITFKSKKVKKLGENKYEMIGDLTIKGITKTITLKGEYTGFIDAGKMGGKRTLGKQKSGPFHRKIAFGYKGTTEEWDKFDSICDRDRKSVV